MRNQVNFISKLNIIGFSFLRWLYCCEILLDFSLHESVFSNFQFVGGDWVKVEKVATDLGGGVGFYLHCAYSVLKTSLSNSN